MPTPSAQSAPLRAPSRRSKTTPAKLRFADYPSLRSHLSRLAAANTTSTTGNWTFGQILYHLAAAIEASCERRAPGVAAPSRLVKFPVRFFALRGFLPRGAPIPEAVRSRVTPPRDADTVTQLARLLSAIDAIESVSHELPIHPVLGYLTPDEWRTFHLRHCELHLGHVRMLES